MLLYATIAGLILLQGAPGQDLWSELVSQAGTLRAKHLYPEAEKLLLEACREAETQGRGVARTAESLNLLATLYLDEGRYKEAEALARRALALAEPAPGRNKAQIGLINASLAEICRAEGRWPDSEHLFRRALAILEQNQRDDLRVAIIMANFAALRIDQGQFSAAQKLMEQAVTIWERAPARSGSSAPSLAAALTNLGAVYVRAARFSEGEASFERAMRLLEGRPDADPDDLAAVYYNIGYLRAVRKSYEGSAEFLQRAADSWTKIRGPQHPNVAMALTILGYVYIRTGRFAEASACLDRALSIREAIFGPHDLNVAEVLFTQADLLRRTHRKAAAKPVEARARAIIDAVARDNRTGQQVDVLTLLQERR